MPHSFIETSARATWQLLAVLVITACADDEQEPADPDRSLERGPMNQPLQPPPAAGAALNVLDGFQPTAADQRDVESTSTQLKGQFLIDRDGVVQWAHIECQQGLADFGKFPSQDELIDAASRVIGGTRVGI